MSANPPTDPSAAWFYTCSDFIGLLLIGLRGKITKFFLYFQCNCNFFVKFFNFYNLLYHRWYQFYIVILINGVPLLYY